MPNMTLRVTPVCTKPPKKKQKLDLSAVHTLPENQAAEQNTPTSDGGAAGFASESPGGLSPAAAVTSDFGEVPPPPPE